MGRDTRQNHTSLQALRCATSLPMKKAMAEVAVWARALRVTGSKHLSSEMIQEQIAELRELRAILKVESNLSSGKSTQYCGRDVKKISIISHVWPRRQADDMKRLFLVGNFLIKSQNFR